MKNPIEYTIVTVPLQADAATHEDLARKVNEKLIGIPRCCPAILLMGVLVPARAQDTTANPTGTYIWTMPARNGGSDLTNTLVLKLNGDNLTGTLAAPARAGQTTTTDISNGKIIGADVSFCVVHTFNDNTVTNKYSGTLANGVIKGKIEFKRNGDSFCCCLVPRPKTFLFSLDVVFQEENAAASLEQPIPIFHLILNG